MNKEKFLEILDKNVNQEQLLKDLAAEFVKPQILALKAKVDSKEIDLIPGTDIDAAVINQVLDAVLAQLGA